MRVRWMDAHGTYYPRGWQATMLRMKELADETPNIEYTPTSALQELLAPNHDQSEGPVNPKLITSLEMTLQMKNRVW